MTRVQANLVLLVAAAIWGGGFIAQTTAMQTMGPLWFVGVRFVIATAVVLPFALRESARAARPMTGREKLVFLAVGLALFGAAATQQIGLLTTNVTNASFLTSLYVIMVPVISLVVLHRPPHRIVWPAAIMALGGIYLLSGGDLSRLSFGDNLMVVSALLWAAQITLAGIAVQATGRPLMLSAVQFGVVAIGALFVAALTEPLAPGALQGALIELLYAGTLSSGLAFVLQNIGQRYTTSAQAAIFLSSEALFGALFGALIMKESLSSVGYIGCALMFGAILIVELVPEITRKRREKAA